MEFKKITNKNLWDVVNLQVKANQKKYIATNTVSLLEAYATQNENERVETFAVYEKDILVGFIMINFNVFNWDGARDCQIFCVNSSFSQIDFLIIYSK